MSNPIWSRTPPCKAHRLLEKMFEEGKITRDTTAVPVHKMHSEFLKFSVDVFRGAFNELRRKHGIGLKRSIFDVDDESCAGTSTITTRSSSKLLTISSGSDYQTGNDAKIVHRNQPVLMAVYQDTPSEIEKVIILVTLPGGVDNVTFSLVGNGLWTSKARITYSWPKIMFDIDALFAKDVKEGKLEWCHPKIMALKNELRNNRDSIGDTPVGVMELTLPIPVKTTADSISHRGVKKDGTMVLIAELVGFFQKAYILQQANTKVTFEEF